MPLIAAPLISWLGWRDTWSVFAVLMIVGGGSAALLLDRGPERHGWLPDGGVADPTAAHEKAVVTGWSIKDAIRSRPFCLLYVGLVFASVGAFVPFVHLVPYAEDHGISHTSAVTIFGMLGIGSTGGRFAVGGLADRIGRGRSLALMFFGLAATLLWWLVATSVWQLTIFALIFGSCQGGFVALYPALTVDYSAGATPAASSVSCTRPEPSARSSGRSSPATASISFTAIRCRSLSAPAAPLLRHASYCCCRSRPHTTLRMSSPRNRRNERACDLPSITPLQITGSSHRRH